MTRRRLLILLAIVAATLVGGAAAWAYWTTPGSGTASATSGSLAAPTDVAVPDSSDGTVHVTWTGSTLSTGQAATGYYVTRVRNSDNSTSAACGTSPSALTASVACDDQDVTDGSYHYVVTAAYHSWTAASDPSGTVTVVTDSTPPAVTLTFPAHGSTYNATGWADGCPTTGVCGTASDQSGVQSVAVSVRQASSGLYWGGSSFDQAAETFVPATGTTSWSLAMARPADGSYTVRVRASDNAGNTTGAASYPSATFTIDTTGPTGGSVSYADGYYTTLSVPVTVVTGTDSGSGVNAPSASLERASASLSNGACGTYGSFAAVTLSGGADTGVVSDRCYRYQYVVSDNVGNTTTYTSASVAKVDTTAPAGGSIGYANGVYTSLSVPITLASGSDTGSGLNAASGLVQRASATLTGGGGGTCGSFGVFAPVTLFGGADTSVVNGTCYKYRYTISDNAGNQAVYSSANIAKVDTAAPTVSSVTLVNNGTAGKAEENDAVAIQYSEQMDATRFCSTWSNSATSTLSGNGEVTVTITNAGGNDTLSVSVSSTVCGGTFKLGTVALGADYVSATTTFAGNGSHASEISLTTGGLLTVTLGTPSSNGNLKSSVTASTPVYTPVAGLTDLGGNALATTAVTGVSSRF